MMNYKFGDVVLIKFPQSGSAQNKKRPALVVLDIGDRDVVLAPVTTRERSGKGDYKLKDWQKSGLLRDSWVRLAKIACLEKNGIERLLGNLTNHDKNNLSDHWKELYVLLPEK